MDLSLLFFYVINEIGVANLQNWFVDECNLLIHSQNAYCSVKVWRSVGVQWNNESGYATAIIAVNTDDINDW